MTGRITIQCIDPDTGMVGCWLFKGESHRIPGTKISPFFRELRDLFIWLNANGWVGIQGTFNYRKP